MHRQPGEEEMTQRKVNRQKKRKKNGEERVGQRELGIWRNIVEKSTLFRIPRMNEQFSGIEVKTTHIKRIKAHENSQQKPTVRVSFLLA